MTAPSPLGSIVYLTSCIIKAKISAEATMPDTPDVYGAELEIMDDQGAIDTSALMGATGPDGQVQFSLRRQDDLDITSVGLLPQNLTDSEEDLGKYWVISTRDTQGTITEQWAYIWMGTSRRFRKTLMGNQGPPGPVPAIRATTTLIDPTLSSFVHTGGSTLAPSWQFNLAVQRGPSGPTSAVTAMPDYQAATLSNKKLLMCTNTINNRAERVWTPTDVTALSPRVYSIPESSFVPGTLTGTKLQVMSYTIPAQPFDWTPVVWGQLGDANTTPTLEEQFTSIFDFNRWGIIPKRIGAQVLLGPNKMQIGRGLANNRGNTRIFPHYSTTVAPHRNITSQNRFAVIRANHTSPAVMAEYGTTPDDSTIYVELINEGVFGQYVFDNDNAQLLVMVVPIDAYDSYARS